MDVQGKIIQVLGERSGTSRAGNPWKVKEYVLETLDQFPRKIAFDFFGDKADQYPLNIGDEITLYFDIESREYQGRWFTSIRGWKAEPRTDAGAPAGAPVPPAVGYGAPGPAPAPAPASDPKDDLPF